MSLFSGGRRGAGFHRVAGENPAAVAAADEVFFGRHPELVGLGYHPLKVHPPGFVETLFHGVPMDRKELRREYWAIFRGAECGDNRGNAPCALDFVILGCGREGRSYELRLPHDGASDLALNPERILELRVDGGAPESLRVEVRRKGASELCPDHRSGALSVEDPAAGRTLLEAPAIPQQVTLEPTGHFELARDLAGSLALWSLPPRTYLVRGRSCESEEMTAKVLLYPDLRWDLRLTLDAFGVRAGSRGRAVWRANGDRLDLLPDIERTAGDALEESAAHAWCRPAVGELLDLGGTSVPPEEWAGLGIDLPVVALRYGASYAELPDSWRVGVVGEYALAFEPFLRVGIDRDVTTGLLDAVRTRGDEGLRSAERLVEQIRRRAGAAESGPHGWGRARLRASGEVAGRLLRTERDDPGGVFQVTEGKDLAGRVGAEFEIVPSRADLGYWMVGAEWSTGGDCLFDCALAADLSEAKPVEDGFLDTVFVGHRLVRGSLTLHLGPWCGVGCVYAPIATEKDDRAECPRSVRPAAAREIEEAVAKRPEHGSWIRSAHRRFRDRPASGETGGTFGTALLLEELKAEGRMGLLDLPRALVREAAHG